MPTATRRLHCCTPGCEGSFKPVAQSKFHKGTLCGDPATRYNFFVCDDCSALYYVYWDRTELDIEKEGVLTLYEGPLTSQQIRKFLGSIDVPFLPGTKGSPTESERLILHKANPPEWSQTCRVTRVSTPHGEQCVVEAIPPTLEGLQVQVTVLRNQE